MNKPEQRKMFPENRIILFIFSPVLGVFFAGFIYFVYLWEPTSTGDSIGKFLLLEILFSFIILCFIAFLSSIIGFKTMQPLINKYGTKASLSGIALFGGFALLLIFELIK